MQKPMISPEVLETAVNHARTVGYIDACLFRCARKKWGTTNLDLLLQEQYEDSVEETLKLNKLW